MDNIFEILVPLVIAGIYFFGNMLSKKSDGDAAPQGGASDDEADAIERQRRIQEEIRRKIMERRRSAEGGAAAPNSGSRQPEPSESARERESPYSHTAESAREPVPRMSRHIEESAPASRVPDLISETVNPYQTKLESKLKQIEATKRQAAKLQKQAAAVSSRSSSDRHSSLPTPRSSSTKGSLRETLVTPAAARAAFIYGEVLGPPVSQRKAQTVPGLQ